MAQSFGDRGLDGYCGVKCLVAGADVLGLAFQIISFFTEEAEIF
jgi:hypothetical protein